MISDSLGWKWICLGVALVCFSGAFSPAPAAEDEKPYRFVDGKVDFATYNGFRRFHNSCHVCHGPDALGTSFGPSLVESLTRISEDDFMEVVVNGRSSNVGGVQRVMPPFGVDPNVMVFFGLWRLGPEEALMIELVPRPALIRCGIHPRYMGRD